MNSNPSSQVRRKCRKIMRSTVKIHKINHQFSPFQGKSDSNKLTMITIWGKTSTCRWMHMNANNTSKNSTSSTLITLTLNKSRVRNQWRRCIFVIELGSRNLEKTPHQSNWNLFVRRKLSSWRESGNMIDDGHYL